MQREPLWPNIKFDQYKLIVSDVDGTLKNVLQPLDPGLKGAIHRLRDAGVSFTIATGKNLKSTCNTVGDLGIELPLILSNGCMIQDQDGNIYQKHRLPDGFVHTLIDVCAAENIELAIHIGEDIYVREITYNASLLLDYGSPDLVEVGEWKNVAGELDQAYKCIALNRNDRQRLFSLEKTVQNLCGTSVEYCHTLVEMLEFMPKGVSKVAGIRTICGRLGIAMDKVLTMGDGNNDVAMLRAAGFGVAVANGNEAVREAAAWIIPSCADQGPRKFLEYFLSQIS